MKRFVRFEIHEYMDEYPQENIQMWEGENEEDITSKCIDYANQMTIRYSGGPTTFVGIMCKDEAKKWVDRKIEEEKRINDFESIECIARMSSMFEEAYN